MSLWSPTAMARLFAGTQIQDAFIQGVSDGLVGTSHVEAERAIASI